MDSIPHVGGPSIEARLNWQDACAAIRAGHMLGRAKIGDTVLEQDANTVLSRSAWVPGLGIGVKTATIFPANVNLELPTVSSVVTLFEDITGCPSAIVDGDLVTKWKTVADSLLGAQILARRDASSLLVVGAGTIAKALLQGYAHIFPGLRRIEIWNRTEERALALVSELAATGLSVDVVADLQSAVGRADIISSATMTREPLLKGEWVAPGTHVDLIGAYKADMREADDALIRKADLYVDSFATTVDHIGELLAPLTNGVIVREDVLGDFYDLCNSDDVCRDADAITLFKNGGGAHLDVMVAKYIASTA